MKTTKTVEIEICDQCGDEATYPHLAPCVHCGKEICTNCCHIFSVEVREVTPHRIDIGHGEMWAHRVRGASEFAFRGTYCGPCSNEVAQTLQASGLVKSPVKKEESGVVLDSHSAM